MYFDYLIDIYLLLSIYVYYRYIYVTCSIVILELCYEFSIIFKISNLQLLKTHILLIYTKFISFYLLIMMNEKYSLFLF